MTIEITRTKLYPTPGKNFRVAWKYLYDSHIPGMQHSPSGFDNLKTLRALLKRKAPTAHVRLAWESEPCGNCGAMHEACCAQCGAPTSRDRETCSRKCASALREANDTSSAMELG